MPRQIYNSHVMYLFKRLPNVILNGQLKPVTHQQVGVRFLCEVTEVIKRAGDLTIGNIQSTTTERIKTVAQLNFEDGDIVAPIATLTDYNGGLINNLVSNVKNNRGSRHRKNPIKLYKFDIG